MTSHSPEGGVHGVDTEEELPEVATTGRVHSSCREGGRDGGRKEEGGRERGGREGGREEKEGRKEGGREEGKG